jgi:hypothetical protein
VDAYIKTIDLMVEQGEPLRDAKRIAMSVAVSWLEEGADQRSWEPLVEAAVAARFYRRTLSAQG